MVAQDKLPQRTKGPSCPGMLGSHTTAFDEAREHGEPAGQFAPRELEVESIRAALQRAKELTAHAAEAPGATGAGSTTDDDTGLLLGS